MSQYAKSFLLSWLASPRRVGAIAPSSEALADLITKEITPSSGPVIELGPGTGVFTAKILEKGVQEQDLTLVEYGSEFATLLQHRFPGVRVVWMDAERLATAKLVEDASIGTIVSGLPLLTMPPKKVVAILSGAFRCLRPYGKFYQFTYAPRFPVSRPIIDRLGLKALLIGRTMQNLPPAAVYRLTRRVPLKLSVQRADHEPIPAHTVESCVLE